MGMSTKLTRKDTFLILICIVAIAVAGYIELSNYHRAFPEHTIDFAVNRKEAQNIALNFLENLNLSPGDKIQASAFEFDAAAKTFLEKEVGLEESEDLLTNHFRIWRWTNRWFEPLGREEIFVGVSPRGEITRFRHKIPEEYPVDILSIDDARRLSHQLLTNVLNINPGDWEFLEDKTEVKPNRVDYRFTYKKKNVEIYDATYRFDLTIQGNAIGEYKEYLHIPEEWRRDYQRLRSLNSTTATTADIFFIILIIIIVTFFIIHLSRRQIQLKTALVFGAITFLLKLLSELNLLPLYKFHMETSQSLGAFYGNFLVSAFLQSLLLAVIITVFAGAGEYIYQRRYPHRIPLGRLFSPEGLRTKHTFFSYIIGISLAIVFMAFQTLFYLAAKRYGAWAPADVSYSDTLNTAFPWILILLGGFLPAVLEEFSFRLFAIPFLEKISKSKLLAVLIPAVIWGFAHANYPNQPFWIRGFEVSVFGILIGFIFLKFGILAVLIWHYMVDAIYSSLLLFRTGEPYHVISASLALGIIMIPFIYNIVMYVRKRRFSDPAPLRSPLAVTHRKDDLPSPPETEEQYFSYFTAYHKFSPRRLKTLVLLMLAFIAILWIPLEKIGGYYEYPYSKSEIHTTASVFLHERGVDADNFKSASVLIDNYSPLIGRYILEHSSVSNLNSLLARYLNNAVVWRVRFYRPLDKEEYNIYVHPFENRVVSFEHLLPETADIFSLNKELARFSAEEFLSRYNFQLADFELVEEFSQQLPNRTEYTFIWETKEEHPANVADGTLRLKTVVTGADVSSFSIYYKIPEEWEHVKTQQTLFDSIRLGLQIAALCLIAIATIVALTRRMKSVTVEWKTPLALSIALGILWLILELANLPVALVNYNTSWGLNVWILFWSLVTLLRVLLITIMLFLVMTLVASIYPGCQTTLRRDCRYHFSRDAVPAAILVSIGIYAIWHLCGWLAIHYAPAIVRPDFQIPQSVNYTLSPIYAIISIISRGIAYAAVLGIIIFWIRSLLSRTWLQVLTSAVLLAIFIPKSYDNIREFLVLYLSSAAIIAWLWVAVICFLRNNIPAYLYCGIIFTAARTSENLVQSGTPKSLVSALAILTVVTILIIWLLTEKKEINIGDWLKRMFKRIVINQ